MSPPNQERRVLNYGDVAVDHALDVILNDRAAADPLKKGDEEEKEVLEKCKRKASGKTLVIIAGGWSYASTRDEITAIGNDSWRPTTADFMAVARGSPQTASTPNEFFKRIASQPNRSVGRVVFIGHGGINGILFSGDSETGIASSQLDTNDIPNFLSFIKKNVRPKLHPNAKIDLVTCTNGADNVFMDAMANAFNRCIRGFDSLIEFRNPAVDDTNITKRGFTRVAGKKDYKEGWKKHLGFQVCVCT